MALKRLLTTEMIDLSNPWVTKGNELAPDHRVDPRGGAAPRAASRRRTRRWWRPCLPSVTKRWRIVEEAARVDARHDGLVNGIHRC